ncbi:MAG: hypothetical protein HYT14_02315 [Candidatus Liptonbacteria bacterium]|nr:hypothetical protein [Candidatus Liptonbacteria bacterium]
MAQSSAIKSVAPKDRVAAPPRFVVVKGVVTTLKEAADIRNRDPKDLE